MRIRLEVILILLGSATAEAHSDGSASTPDSARVAVQASESRVVLRAPKVSGYVQLRYRNAPATSASSRFDGDELSVARLRVSIDGDIAARVSYEIEFDPRATSIAGLLRDAFVTFKLFPRHELRLGQQKTQFGYENRESSGNLFTVNRAEVSDALARGPSVLDVGVGLIGDLSLANGVTLEDATTVVNGNGPNAPSDDTPRKSAWGRWGLRYRSGSHKLGARLGVSGGTGDWVDAGNDPLDAADDERRDFARVGADLELDHPRFFLSAEYLSGKETNHATAALRKSRGYYVSLVGKSPWRIGPTVRYEEFDAKLRRWTVGTFLGLPAETLRAMVNYELRTGNGGVRGDDRLYLWAQVRF
ncbi:MAG: hypothetical protein HOP12_00660 [Candidatus Eisenbacteria bacterium]|uniref:Porin n=1 Tax=Eiseniibacteriota bacterium TaxID=2212470 RepID=A0A849SGI1_UNCEI|nr:hypothetical protein [Candidatus Eisenbacteria bacterium]